MTNYEYYRQTIDKITRMGRMVAVEEKTGKVTSCNQITCLQCRFDSCSAGNCDAAALAWADDEHIEPEVDWTKVAVDTPILVKDSMESDWLKRYFAKYESNLVYAWADRKTSHTTDSTAYWYCAKLAEVECLAGEQE